MNTIMSTPSSTGKIQRIVGAPVQQIPPHKRPSTEPHRAPAKKSKKAIDKNLPRKIEVFVPESKLYGELQDLEKRVDALIVRKKMELQESLAKSPKMAKRYLRIFISNTASDQINPSSEDFMDITNANIPSWTLRIEGRLLDAPHLRKGMAIQTKFSQLIKSVIVTIDRDPALYPEGNIIEWRKPHGGAECDGFEIKRRGDTDVKAKIAIHLDPPIPKFKLSAPLSALLCLHTDTRTNIISALWKYIKLNKLQDSEDKRVINCDDGLKRLLPNTAHVLFSQLIEMIEPHLLPADPITLEYTIRVDEGYHASRYVYDVEIELEDMTQKKAKDFASANAALQKELEQYDDQIINLVQHINQAKMKRDFMAAFAKDPCTFINHWMASQSRDLETILGDNRVSQEEMRRSAFYKDGWTQEAIFHYLAQQDQFGSQS
ncbi:SWI/SNF and RSC complex subunit Ssr3 [Polychytrium aggregatum]|uniref:SWI/SNF and RSC complex subunit Ssr3 n=1 Tax=Polychytrium aggregatum TaxID=110093 RepID=UPI0022FDCBA9|nr:SWI/SNF and RSC complex subunit Ssr3 [Polychytrium aggregatum]KAI9207962.1 SWI/SNF and RSC complex subunit Ssr3 [Polychytrium aggregatum]